MARNICWWVACLSVVAWLPPGLALGIGDIKSHSVLNQPFDAEINLLSVTKNELETIRVRLADAKAFQRAGVERHFYLTLLKFEPKLNQQGKPTIQVSSNFPIREPFLNFIIEVDSPSGLSMLREYTVLLDPPTFAKQGSIDKPEPVTPPAAKPSVLPQEHGPIKQSASLWDIARRIKPDNASIYQTMLAIQKANPEAFIDGNVHLMRQDKILRLPGANEIRALAEDNAVATYRQQTQAKAEEKPTIQQIERQQESAEIEPKPQEQAEITIHAKVGPATGAKPESESSSADGADVQNRASLNQAMLLLRKDVAASAQEIKTMRGQMGELEAQLEDMQRLIALKDEQLARMQANRVRPLQTADITAPAVPETRHKNTNPLEELLGILSKPLYLAGIGGILLLILVLWLIRRNRQQADDEAWLAEEEDGKTTAQNKFEHDDGEWQPVAVAQGRDEKPKIAEIFVEEAAADDIDDLVFEFSADKPEAKDISPKPSQRAIVDKPLNLGEAFDALASSPEPEQEADNMANANLPLQANGPTLSEFQQPEDQAVDTKLDLARVYIDMDDLEGARDILHEVRIEGSSKQKNAAQELLAQIA